jgi:adenylosuccinate lyase
MDSISPIDNRYFDKVKEIANNFSYFSWIKYRVKIEVDYLIALAKLLHNQDLSHLEKLYKKFNIIEMNVILDFERKTKHDIKAIEYYIASFIPTKKNLVHFGLTSQDVNSMAFSLQLKDCINDNIIPQLYITNSILNILSEKWKDITILAYTHGQPAIPTKMGKEIKVFTTRLNYWYQQIKDFQYYTKIGGAVGNLNAHKLAYPDIDWVKFFNNFVKKYDLKRWQKTTQITNHDDIVNILSHLVNVNNLLIDLCQDMWLYISKGYFGLKKDNKDQVGSSTMPQKVNPIDFENAEGNLKIANSGLEMLINKLPISRLQRDLTDSTVLRNTGVYLAHSLLAYKNIVTGLEKLTINLAMINKDLDTHPECLSEGIQTLMRVYNIDGAYDIMRLATQNKTFTSLEAFKDTIIEFIDNNISCPDILIERIKKLTMFNY